MINGELRVNGDLAVELWIQRGEGMPNGGFFYNFGWREPACGPRPPFACEDFVFHFPDQGIHMLMAAVADKVNVLKSRHPRR